MSLVTDLQQTERGPSRLSRRIESYQSCASRRDGELVVETVLMRLKKQLLQKKKRKRKEKATLEGYRKQEEELFHRHHLQANLSI